MGIMAVVATGRITYGMPIISFAYFAAPIYISFLGEILHAIHMPVQNIVYYYRALAYNYGV